MAALSNVGDVPVPTGGRGWPRGSGCEVPLKECRRLRPGFFGSVVLVEHRRRVVERVAGTRVHMDLGGRTLREGSSNAIGFLRRQELVVISKVEDDRRTDLRRSLQLIADARSVVRHNHVWIGRG